LELAGEEKRWEFMSIYRARSCLQMNWPCAPFNKTVLPNDGRARSHCPFAAFVLWRKARSCTLQARPCVLL